MLKIANACKFVLQSSI